MRLSLIMPQHGQPDLTLRSIFSLLAHHEPPHELLIVDDGSPAVDRAALKALGRQIMIVPIPRRRGVTAAWNVGARIATGDVLIFLNNDTITGGPWMQQLTSPLRPAVRSTHDDFTSAPCAVMTGVGLRHEPDLPHTFAADTDRLLPGWCFAILRETWTGLGGFDERFRMYYSDTDLQCRLLADAEAADPLIAVPDLPLKHLGHRSTQRLRQRRSEWRSDRARFLQKWCVRKDREP